MNQTKRKTASASDQKKPESNPDPEPEKVVIAVSSGSLFHDEQEGEETAENMETPFAPGPALDFVKALNNCWSPTGRKLFHILVTYHNNAKTEKLTTTISHYDLKIKVVLIQDGDITRELLKRKTILYLSDNPQDVKGALGAGMAAATMFPLENPKEVGLSNTPNPQLRVAFDGDGVLFSGESELIYQRDGLEAFSQHQKENQDQPMRKGPFKDFLVNLVKLQNIFPEKDCPIRTYLVTARSPDSSGIRALITLKAWGLEMGEALFLRGSKKGPMLEAIKPHIFFDDQEGHVANAREKGITAAHVPSVQED